MKEPRVKQILATIQDIQSSRQSVSAYFETHSVGFSRVQYYNYLKIMKQHGEAGLRDKRRDGNNRRLTQDIADYVRVEVRADATVSAAVLQGKIEGEFEKTISRSTLSDFRKSEKLTRERIAVKEQCSSGPSGGGEILTSLAFSSGIIDLLTKTIVRRRGELRKSSLFSPDEGARKDHPRYRVKGRFTKEYNQLKSVRESRFKSIDEKIPGKNYSSMDIFKKSERNISRYNLALLCLPLVTSNGRSSRANRVKGNDLAFLCGYNYKDAALDKYLRELKYLKVSEELIADTAKFWMEFWKEKSGEQVLFVCYYIDGNTKALWSSGRCYKGKVTMLGRVMNCLENVFIHDGKGHPLYFQTFRGHADLGKHALGMITRLTTHFGELSSQIAVRRILVMDGGGNSVKTMRAFGDSDENFITILDKNQVKERRFKHLGRKERYRYGNATLVDCQIELADSSESGYIYQTRAVVVKWGNGRESVLLTDIPSDLLDASEITKRYFDRWPYQEKRFRDVKIPLSIHRVVGYGKKIEADERMKEKYAKTRKSVNQLRRKLKGSLVQLEGIERDLVELDRRERRLRESSKLELGKRILGAADRDELKECEREINRLLRQQKEIEREHKDEFKKLREKTKEAERIRFKTKVYRIDTELDQIMTCFKLSFANLCSLLLSECMDNERYEILTLFESFFDLDAIATKTESEKLIKLHKNPKDTVHMETLKECLKKLNSLETQDLEGRTMQFELQDC